MADLRQAIEYAKQNPNTAFASELRKRIESGQLSTQPAEPEVGFVGGVGQDFAERRGNLAETNQRFKSGEQSFGSTVLQHAGQIAGGAGDLVTRGVSAVTPDKVKDFASKGINKIAEQEPVQNTLRAYESWKQENPVAAANLESIANVGSLLAGTGAGRLATEGAIATKTAVKTAVRAADEAVNTVAGAARKEIKNIVPGVGRTADEKLTDSVWEAVQPKLSKSEANIARKEGLVTESKFGATKLVPSDADQELIDVAKRWINPSDDVNGQIKSAQGRVRQLNQSAKSYLKENDGIFTTKELKTAVESSKRSDAARRSVIFGGDEKLEAAYDSMVNGFMSVVQKHPKKYSSLLDARQEFDRIADSIIPKAFDTEARDTVKKIALRDIRNASKQFLVDRVKGGKALADTLKEESLLLEAVDNITERAPRIGDTVVKRLKNKYPIASKVASGAAKATGLGAGIGLAP